MNIIFTASVAILCMIAGHLADYIPVYWSARDWYDLVNCIGVILFILFAAYNIMGRINKNVSS